MNPFSILAGSLIHCSPKAPLSQAKHSKAEEKRNRNMKLEFGSVFTKQTTPKFHLFVCRHIFWLLVNRKALEIS